MVREQKAVSLLALAEGVLRLLAAGDIVRNRRAAHDFTRSIGDRRDRDGDVQEAAVRLQGLRLQVDYPLSTLNLMEHRSLLLEAFGRRQNRDAPAYDLIRLVAVEFFRATIPA